jgi:hypothetical protein
MSTPTDPLSGAGSALGRFDGQTGQLAGLLRGSTAPWAGPAAGRLRSAADQAGSVLREVRAQADAVVTSLTAAARGQRDAVTGFGGATDSARSARGSLEKLKSGIGRVMSVLGRFVPATGPVARLTAVLGTAMTVASFAIDAVNVAMRANPLGFVAGLLVPIAAQLIALALDSETGRRITEKVFAQAVRVVKGVVTFIAPALKALATVVATYLRIYFAVVSGVLKAIGITVTRSFALVRALVSRVGNALPGIVSRAWNGLRSVVSTTMRWITKDIPAIFGRVKDAMSRTLDGIGDFLTTGMQTALGVLKGPLSGLTAFANWIIDGLNHTSFSLLGKEFGVHLPKIPMLADGGIVLPAVAHRAGRVLPLSDLDRRLGIRTAGRRAGGPVRLGDFHESATAGARGTAEDLLFLAAAHA